MNQDVKALWIEDLLTNPDLQGFDALEQDEKFCCLGRLCLLAIKNRVKVTREISDSGVVYYDGEVFFLPESVAKWAGLNSRNPAIKNTSVSVLNDSRVAFDRIADMIDTYL